MLVGDCGLKRTEWVAIRFGAKDQAEGGRGGGPWKKWMKKERARAALGGG